MSILLSLVWLKFGCIISDTELLYYNDLNEQPTIDGWDLTQGNHFCDGTVCPLPNGCCWEVQTTGHPSLSFNINVTGYKNIQFMYSVLPHAYSSSAASDCIFAYNVNGGIWNGFDMYGNSDEDIQYNNVTYNTPVEAWNADNLGFRLSIGNMFVGHCSLYNVYVFGDLINSNNPTITPTNPPTSDTRMPSLNPTNNPSQPPTNDPTNTPTNIPTNTPTNIPSKIPTDTPTVSPTSDPSTTPTLSPSVPPTQMPSTSPTRTTTLPPSSSPTISPSMTPSVSPTNIPTSTPTQNPTFIDIRSNIDTELSIGICDDLILDATDTEIINADKKDAVFTWIFNNGNLEGNIYIGQYIIISNTLLTDVNYLYNISLLITIESTNSSINFGVYKNDIIKPQLKLQSNQIRNNILTVSSEIIFDDSCVENRTSIDYTYEWTITDDTITEDSNGNNTISVDLISFQVCFTENVFDVY